MVDNEGNITTGAYDLVPILDAFVEKHPDFSYHGSKAVLALTGYNGLFGYRTHAAGREALGEETYEKDVAAVKDIAEALKKSGYELACYTYENKPYGIYALSEIQADMSRWNDEVVPILGQLDIMVFAQNSDINNGILYSGEWRKHCVSVIDAKDMANLKTLKTVNLQGFGDGVWTYGNYLYVATGQHLGDESLPYEKRRGMGHGMEIFDISDPVNPKHISRIGFDFCHMSANDLWTPRPCSGGKYVAVADTYNGFYVVDAHNYENLSILTKLSFTCDDNGKAAPVTSLAIGKGVIYISVFDGLGFYALVCPEVYPDVKEKGVPPTNANYRYDYSTSETSKFHAWRPESKAPVRGLAAKGSLLYAACSYGGLAILQQKKSGEVKLLGYGPMKFAGDVKVEGDILWVAEGFDGLPRTR
jgi:hypothetical protein